MPSAARDPEDRGAASLTIVLLTPLMVVLMFAAFQAAMWNHARTELRVVAREAAVLVARDGLDPSQATSAAQLTLARDSLVSAATVHVTTAGGVATVTISGRAPGVLRGTSAPVSVKVAMPLEGWVPL